MTRIIAGRFGGRRLRVPRAPDLRPTADRVREAWFSILQPELDGATVLDLYAGTGALGLEALSRGAAFAVFVEQHRGALDMLRANVESLDIASSARIIRAEALSFLDRLEAPVDVAFADPPYRSDAALRLVKRFHAAPFARVFSVEHDIRLELGGDETRRYGDTGITFCRV